MVTPGRRQPGQGALHLGQRLSEKGTDGHGVELAVEQSLLRTSIPASLMREQLWRSVRRPARGHAPGQICRLGTGTEGRSAKEPGRCSSPTVAQTQLEFRCKEWLIFVFLGNLFHLFARGVDIVCASPVVLMGKTSGDVIRRFTWSVVELGTVPGS